VTGRYEILGEWQFTVEAGKIREFARAVKDVSGGDHPRLAPPTFLVTASADFVEHLVTDVLRLDRSRSVHGAQEYAFFGPVAAGDRLVCRARLISDEIKAGRRGGTMRIVTTETEFRRAGTEELVCRDRCTTIEKAVMA
jgi:hypothetical protein